MATSPPAHPPQPAAKAQGGSPNNKPKVAGPFEVDEQRHYYNVHGTRFEVPKHYEVTKALGVGAYGFVCAALNKQDNTKYAIKMCGNVFNEIEDGKRVLREIKLLAFMKHENLLGITDLLPPRDRKSFDDIYIVGDLMDTDLSIVLRSRQRLTDEHYQYFVYQILRGLKYIHSASVLHRDLKPANLLTNIACDLRICDFGLSRAYNPDLPDDQLLTDYVVTRWYRPPELLLMCTQYTPAVDIWSCGCIFAELMNRKPLFAGENYLDQLTRISEAIGTPVNDDMSWITNEEAKRYLQSMPKKTAKPWHVLVPKLTDPVAQDFISRMLVFNPTERASAEELLAHPYLEQLHDPNDEPNAPTTFDWDFKDGDERMTEEELRELFYQEVLKYHPELKDDGGAAAEPAAEAAAPAAEAEDSPV